MTTGEPFALTRRPRALNIVSMDVREAWQRFYFKGEMPAEIGPAPKEHVNKRRLKSVRLGF